MSKAARSAAKEARAAQLLAMRIGVPEIKGTGGLGS